MSATWRSVVDVFVILVGLMIATAIISWLVPDWDPMVLIVLLIAVLIVAMIRDIKTRSQIMQKLDEFTAAAEEFNDDVQRLNAAEVLLERVEAAEEQIEQLKATLDEVKRR